VTDFKGKGTDDVLAPGDVTLVFEILVTECYQPDLFSDRHGNLLFFHLGTWYTTSLMMYTCILELDGKTEKKTTWSTLQEAQTWAVTHARIVPGIGKYTVKILQGEVCLKSLF